MEADLDSDPATVAGPRDAVDFEFGSVAVVPDGGVGELAVGAEIAYHRGLEQQPEGAQFRGHGAGWHVACMGQGQVEQVAPPRAGPPKERTSRCWKGTARDSNAKFNSTVGVWQRQFIGCDAGGERGSV